MDQAKEERIRLFRKEFGEAVYKAEDKAAQDKLEVMIYRLDKMDYFTAPASTKYHGAHEGGLFEHSMNVMRSLVHLTKALELHWIRPESPYIIGAFHDLCKCDQYERVWIGEDDGRIGYQYRKNTLLKGHGTKSVAILSTFMQLSEEEVSCITYHMGAFCPEEEWKDYTHAIHTYPNVLWTHTADMMAAHILEV